MKKAFTLFETIVVMVLIGIISTILITNLRPKDVKEEALIKAGKDMYIQIEYATAQIIANNTRNFTLTRLVNGTNEISIASSTSQDALLHNFYKKYLKGLRNVSINTTYKSANFKNSAGSSVGSSLNLNKFANYKLKNEAYFGVRLHGNCTTSETYLYNPSKPTSRTQSNSCGQIFFDVNGEDLPNAMGIDQYLVSLTACGVR